MALPGLSLLGLRPPLAQPLAQPLGLPLLAGARPLAQPLAPLPAASPPPSENLSVSGLPFDITDEKVRTVLGQYGMVAQVKVLPPMPGRPDREAFVRMSKVEEAKWMVDNVNDNVLDGMTQPVVVRFSAHKGPLSPWGGLPTSANSPAPMAAAAALGLGAVAPLLAAPPAQKPVPVGVILSGTVRRWDAVKGFGFIGPDSGGPDVFVHVRELTDGEMLVPGSKVMFEAMLDTARGPDKYRAKMCLGAKPKEVAVQAAVSDKLYILGLPLDTTEEMITSVFSQYGGVISVTKVSPPAGATEAGALLHMADINEAKWLVDNVNQNIPVGMATPVTISYAPATTSSSPAAAAGVGASTAASGVLSTAGAGYGKALPPDDAGTTVGPY